MNRGFTHIAPVLAPVLALFCSAAVLVSGCASTGQPSDSGTQSPRASASTAPDNRPDNRPAHRKLGYRLEWRGAPVISRRARIEDVSVLDDIVVVRDSSNTVSVIEVDTGTNRWAGAVAKPLDVVHGTILGDDGQLLVSTDINLLVYSQKTGTLEDRQKYSILASTAPARVGRYLCLGGENGQMLIHNVISGYRQHAYDFGARFEIAPVQIGGLVGAVARNGRVFIIDPHTGSSVGRTRVYANVSAGLAASDDALFVASHDQSLWAFNAQDASTRWRIRTEGKLTHTPVHHAGVVYAVIPKRGLSAFDALTGELLWENPEVFAQPIAKRGDRIITWDGSHAFAIQAVSGDIMERLRLPGVDRLLTDRFDDGDLYFVLVGSGEVRKHSPIR